MKKLILIIVASLLFIHANAQSQPKTQFSKDYYLEKSNKQKRIAHGLLAGGATLVLVAAAIHKKSDSPLICLTNSCEEPPNNDFSIAVGRVGVASVLASIPMFISAGINKRKAAKVVYEYRPLQVNPVYVQQNREHALVFRISLE